MDKGVVVVGITGGPATGKSLVTAEFRRLGAAVIDADIIAREVLTSGRAEYIATVSAFGEAILCPDGTIDRKALGDIVFADKNRLAELTAITHPGIISIIRETIARLKEEGSSPVIALDAPLLFEAGLEGDVDKIIVVFTDRDVQLKRLMDRDGLGETEAVLRVASQMPLAQKKRRAHCLIDNNGPRGKTLLQVRRIYEKLILENS